MYHFLCFSLSFSLCLPVSPDALFQDRIFFCLVLSVLSNAALSAASSLLQPHWWMKLTSFARTHSLPVLHRIGLQYSNFGICMANKNKCSKNTPGNAAMHDSISFSKRGTSIKFTSVNENDYTQRLIDPRWWSLFFKFELGVNIYYWIFFLHLCPQRINSNNVDDPLAFNLMPFSDLNALIYGQN